MNDSKTVWILILLFATLPAYGQTVTLEEFLSSAWDQSPVKNGERYKEQEASERVESARGKYLPHVSIDAIDSTGFPASNSALGVEGLMGSPYRSGPAAGIVVQQTLFDFGRIHAELARTHALKGLDEARIADDKMKFLSMLGRLYLACAQTNAVQVLDETLQKTALLVQKETGKFTRTGQGSVVDNELARVEVDDINIQQKQLRELQQSLAEQMSLYAGKNVNCQDLAVIDHVKLQADLQVRPPQILLAKAQMQEAESLVEESKSLQLPLLNLMGSIGDMQASRVVSKQDYALGVGLVFPLWDGGEEHHREASFKNRVSFQEEGLKVARLEYQTWLKNLKDAQVRNQDLVQRLRLHAAQVRHTLDLATKRFFKLQGTLVDVRDSFARLREIENNLIRTESSLAYSTLDISLLDSRGDTL